MVEEKFKAKRKPRKCPGYGSAKIARILYGLPGFSPELQKDLQEGRKVLGGCCISLDDSTWQCIDCEAQIHKELEDIFK